MTLGIEINITADNTGFIITDKTEYENVNYLDTTQQIVAVWKSYEKDIPLKTSILRQGNHNDQDNIIYDQWRADVEGDGWHHFYLFISTTPMAGAALESYNEYIKTPEALESNSFTYGGTVYRYEHHKLECFSFPTYGIEIQEHREQFLLTCDCESLDKRLLDLLDGCMKSALYNYDLGKLYDQEGMKQRAQYVLESYEVKKHELR